MYDGSDRFGERYSLWQFDGDRLVDEFVEVLSLFPEALVDGWTLALAAHPGP